MCIYIYIYTHKQHTNNSHLSHSVTEQTANVASLRTESSPILCACDLIYYMARLAEQ